MSSFNKLEELLNTTEGMTVLRNNSANDDSTDTVTGVDWFTFNGVVANSIYVSGNTWVGFGVNSEQLKICRRDAKMWYLYRQEGTIGTTKFLKIRWEGYTYYSSTSSQYALKWELFLFDDGGLYLNLVQVPTNSSYLGTSQLICGSNTYNFTVAASIPVAYSFLLQDAGTFVVSTDIYPVQIERVSSGFAEFVILSIQKISNVRRSKISWNENIPENTTLKVLSKLSEGTYAQCENGGEIVGIRVGQDLSAETLYIKVEMATNDPFKTPALDSIKLEISDQSDSKKIILNFPSGNVSSIQRAIGDITVVYDGTGTLKGEGGPALAFEQVFTPKELDPKNNPHIIEHIDADIQATAVLKRVFYKNYSCKVEHVELSDMTASGVLTHVDDL